MKSKLINIFNRWYFNIVIFLIMFVAPFIVYNDLFAQDMLLAGGDGLGTAYNLIFMKNSFSEGEFPLWNKYISNGVPYAGDVSNHAFFLIGIVLSFLPEKLYVYTFYAFHIALGAFFTFLYLKEIGCNKLLSMCMGFIYLFSIHMGGYRKGHLMIITCIVYLPVILYFIEKYIKKSKIKWLIFSAFAMALQFYNAFLQDVMYTDILVFIYLLVMCIRNKIKIKKMIYDGLIWLFSYFGLIAMQLIPTFEMMREYGRAGTSNMTYDMFSSYSIHFIKLLQMIFPYIFGDNVYNSFGQYVSSEMDVEIFLGHFVLVLMIIGIIKFFSDFRIKLSMIIMMGTFLFAAQAHIPILSRILYNLPLVGNMRCSSRILFIFIFFSFVICGITLDKFICGDKAKDIFVLSVKISAFIIVILAVAVISVFIAQGSNGFPEEQIKKVFDYFNKTFIKDLLFIVLIPIVIYFVYKAKINMSNTLFKKTSYIFYLLVMLISIVETYQFSTRSSPVSVDILGLNDEASRKVYSEIDNYKVWDAFPSMDGAHTSIISQNLGMAKGIPSINAYISLNNPRIYRLFSQEYKAEMNFSGLLTGSFKAKQNLELQNDLLSMLGVKYIIDSYGLIGENSNIYSIKNLGDELVNIDSISIPNLDGELFVYSSEVRIKPNTYYSISFDIESGNFNDDIYYIDFYAGELYDSPNQQANLLLNEEKKEYHALINSGNCPDDGIAFVRFIGNADCEGIIRNFTVNEVVTDRIENVYLPYYYDETAPIYLNVNAKDVLFTPQAVKSIHSFEDLYTNVFEYDLDDISYVENFKSIDLTGTRTEINITDYKNNIIRAEISSSTDSFVNFSQNFYPGWRAYVNGKKVPVYMVNGLIQGIEVPAGDNIIEFKFQPVSIYIGGVISLLTLCAAVLVILNERKKLRL